MTSWRTVRDENVGVLRDFSRPMVLTSWVLEGVGRTADVGNERGAVDFDGCSGGGGGGGCGGERGT